MPERFELEADDLSETEQDKTPWTAEDFAEQPGQPPALWPCWAWGYSSWLNMADQWRAAPMGGLIGLDLTALPIVEERIGMPQEERRSAYIALRVFANAQQAQWRKDKPPPTNKAR